MSLTFALVWLGCTGGTEVDEVGTQAEAIDTSPAVKAEELRIEVGRNAIAYDYFASNHIPHGIAGDERFVFVTQPLSGRVSVNDRLTGREISTLPPPPSGWALPFALRVPNSGRLVVLDSGGFPSPTLQAVARLYEYDYTWNRQTRTFSATLVRTIDFGGLPLVFTEDFEALPSGGYVVSESIIGALWNVAANGTITPGLLPSSFAPGAGIPAIGPCEFTPITIAGVPFGTGGNFAPGISSLAVRNGQLYFGSTCAGGIQRIPLASLSDATRSPEQRAADIRVVTSRPSNVVEESLHGLAFNRFDSSDNRLYATDSLQRRVIRINTSNGNREVLADDAKLFDFPVGISFLPPVEGIGPFVVASDQEYRLAALNPLISTDQLHPPFVVAKVYVLR